MRSRGRSLGTGIGVTGRAPRPRARRPASSIQYSRPRSPPARRRGGPGARDVLPGMPDPLGDNVALVTGGGTGIGRAIALALAGAGASVAVNYSRSREEAEATAQEIRAHGGRALAVRADVSQEQDVEAMVDRVALTGEIWDRILAVNLKGAFFCSRAAARVMTDGRIINIGSVAGISGAGSSIAYAASKGAIHTMTKSLARALAPRITVNAIAPGLIETRWHAGREAVNARRASSFPAGRIGRPEDVAHIALALATSGNFVTGQIVVVDGGALL